MNSLEFARRSSLLGHTCVILIQFTGAGNIPDLCPFATENPTFLLPDDLEESRGIRRVLFNQQYQGDLAATAWFFSPNGHLLAKDSYAKETRLVPGQLGR